MDKEQFLKKMHLIEKRDYGIGAELKDLDEKIISEIVSLLGTVKDLPKTIHSVRVALVINNIYSHNSRWEELGRKLEAIFKKLSQSISLMKDKDVDVFLKAGGPDDEEILSRNITFMTSVLTRIKKYKEFISTKGRKKNTPLHLFLFNMLWVWKDNHSDISINRGYVISGDKQNYYGPTFEFLYRTSQLVFGNDVSAETVGSIAEKFKEKSNT